MSAISQLLLTRFWWNFKGRFLWTIRTDSNCQGDICPRNICPRNICPYQEYLSCYWPDFDEILKVGSCEHLEQIPTVRVIFVHATFVLVTFVHIRNISAVTDLILMKLYRKVPGNTQNRIQLSRWHFSRQNFSWRYLSISGISQLLLTRFWRNFKGRFLGISRTDSNCSGNICPDPILTKL